MTHTKGPWTVAKLSGDKDIFIDTACGLSIGSLYSVEVGTEETQANARLISAAPEMLAALEDCLNFITAKDDEAQDFKDEVRQLIKKAKGL